MTIASHELKSGKKISYYQTGSGILVGLIITNIPVKTARLAAVIVTQDVTKNVNLHLTKEIETA